MKRPSLTLFIIVGLVGTVLLVIVFAQIVREQREAAMRDVARENMRQIGLALQNYQQSTGGLIAPTDDHHSPTESQTANE